MKLLLLLALFVIAAAKAAPVYPEMFTRPLQQRSLAHEVVDRSNAALVFQILEFFTLANAGFVYLKWFTILCVLVPTRCGSTNPTNVHMYDALEIANILNSTDTMMPNLNAQDVSTVNSTDLASIQMNTPSLHEQAVQQKHFLLPSLKTINPFEQLQKTGQHQAELKTGTVETRTLSIISRPHITFVPHSEFRWPIYRDLLYYPSPSVSSLDLIQ